MYAKKDSLIKGAEREVQFLLHKIEILNKIDRKGIYRIPYPAETNESLLIQVVGINVLAVNVSVLAATIPFWNNSPHISYNYVHILNPVEVPLTDLATYVGWVWKSLEFETLLKGR